MESFSVQTMYADEETILQLSGELDMATAPEVDVGVADALRQVPRARRLVVDVHELAFCDVVGLHGLLRAHASADENGCTFALRAPSFMLLRLITAAGLSERFDPLQTQTDAPIGTEHGALGSAVPGSDPRRSGIPVARGRRG